MTSGILSQFISLFFIVVHLIEISDARLPVYDFCSTVVLQFYLEFYLFFKNRPILALYSDPLILCGFLAIMLKNPVIMRLFGADVSARYYYENARIE